jgi:hypothetical protein
MNVKYDTIRVPVDVLFVASTGDGLFQTVIAVVD